MRDSLPVCKFFIEIEKMKNIIFYVQKNNGILNLLQKKRYRQMLGQTTSVEFLISIYNVVGRRTI